MLVTLKEILDIAEQRRIAIGAFNTPNMVTLKAVISVAEQLSEPVIIMHAQVHEEMGICRMEEIAPLMLAFARAASVPVCVHLDHGTDIEYVKRGLEIGFTSVMYDGSALSEDENTEATKYAVSLAKQTGASVEAEIGSMGAREGGAVGDESIYTDPEAAAAFVSVTGIDALACAFGTAHGFYKDKPKLDFERLSKIDSMITAPIVMHGGSGVSEDDYREVISRGVRKINYYTYMAKAGAEAISGKQYSQLHDALIDAEHAIAEDVRRAICIFTGKN